MRWALVPTRACSFPALVLWQETAKSWEMARALRVCSLAQTTQRTLRSSSAPVSMPRPLRGTTMAGCRSIRGRSGTLEKCASNKSQALSCTLQPLESHLFTAGDRSKRHGVGVGVAWVDFKKHHPGRSNEGPAHLVRVGPGWSWLLVNPKRDKA